MRSRTHGPLVLGANGTRRLHDDHVEGTDPLALFGRRAADDLRRHDRLLHVHHQLVAWLEQLGQRRQLPQVNRTVR